MNTIARLILSTLTLLAALIMLEAHHWSGGYPGGNMRRDFGWGETGFNWRGGSWSGHYGTGYPGWPYSYPNEGPGCSSPFPRTTVITRKTLDAATGQSNAQEDEGS
jgi:hypothetical protein